LTARFSYENMASALWCKKRGKSANRKKIGIKAELEKREGVPGFLGKVAPRRKPEKLEEGMAWETKLRKSSEHNTKQLPPDKKGGSKNQTERASQETSSETWGKN